MLLFRKSKHNIVYKIRLGFGFWHTGFGRKVDDLIHFWMKSDEFGQNNVPCSTLAFSNF